MAMTITMAMCIASARIHRCHSIGLISESRYTLGLCCLHFSLSCVILIPMTYNFDPEAWHLNQLALLQSQRQSGLLDDEAYAAAEEELNRRYEAMLDRLDGSYVIPESSD
ncbi:MAG: hypothetical protein GY906_17385 [bacterium]|nr:hypothetical protein [bacterium]